MLYNELFANEFDTQILRKKLAKAIGLNEAIVLNQLHYWVEKNKRTNHNFYDGKYWVYNTYEDWQMQDFEYWSVDTIKRAFGKLEKSGLVISANYNKMPMDRTKWYTIDYEKMEELAREIAENPVNSTIRAKCTDAKVQNAPMQQGNLHRPIPENTNKEYLPENTTEDYIGTKQSLRTTEPVFDFAIVEKQIKKTLKNIGYESDKELADNIIDVFRYYYDKYYRKFRQEHTILSDKAMQGTIMRYIEGTDVAVDLQYNADSYKTMIDRHFERQYVREIDYSICHFMTEGIRNCLYYEVLY